MRSKPPKREDATLASAQRLLARREHSRHELRQKLLIRGFDASAVETVLLELERRGWLSEERFCEAYVNSRRSRRVGPLRIIAELQARGVAAGVARLAVNPSAEQWQELALAEYRKCYGDSAPQSPSDYARRVRHLASRGYPADLVRKVCKHCLKPSNYVD